MDVESFTGQNVHGFNPAEVFMQILLHCLGQKCLLLKRGTSIHGKAFTVLLKTVKV